MDELIIGRGYKWRGVQQVGVDAAKRVRLVDGKWRPAEKRTEMPSAFQVERYDVADVYEVYETLTEVQTGIIYGNECEILGTLTEYAEDLFADGARTIHRLNRDKGARRATFRDAPTHSHQLDIDCVHMGDGLTAHDPIERHVEWLRRSVLPPELSDVAMLAMLTGSWGASSNLLKLRLRFFTNKPRTLAQFRKYVNDRLNPYMASRCYFTGKSPCDVSVYQAARMMFFLPPVIVGGGKFPWRENRLTVIEGDRLEAQLPNEAKQPRVYDRQTSPDALRKPGGSFGSLESALALIDDHSHDGMLRVGMWFGETYAPHNLRDAIEAHKPEIDARLRETARDHEHYLKRVAEELDNDALMRSALDWQSKRTEWNTPVVQGSEDVDGDYATEERTDEAREQMRAEIESCIHGGIAQLGNPAHTLARVPTGGGKTTAMLDALTEAHIYDNLIHIFVPNHQLKNQIYNDLLQRFPNEQTQALIHKHNGRGQPGMCPDRDKSGVYDAMASKMEQAGASPKPICDACPLRDECAHYNQQLPEVGLALFTHADLVTTCAQIKPESKRAAVFSIIDEDCTSALVPGEPRRVQLSALAPDAHIKFIKNKLGFSPSLTADFAALRKCVVDALTKHSEYFVPLDGLKAIMSKSNEIQKAEWGAINQVTEEIAKGIERGDVFDEKAAAAAIQRSRFVIDLVDAISASANSRFRDHVYGLRVVAGKTAILSLRNPLPEYILANDCLYLDATGNEAIWRQFATGVDNYVMTYDIKPTHYTATQVIEPRERFHKAALVKDGPKMKRRLQDVVRLIKHKSYEHKRVLVVCQKSVRSELENKADLPDNVQLAHYNALRGLNEFEHVPCLILLGRVAAPSNVVTLMHEALTYDDEHECSITIHDDSEKVSWSTVEHTIRDGAGGTYRISATTLRHAVASVVPIVEAITDAEAKQALGRARLVNRSAGNPCEVIILNNVPMDIALDHVAYDLAQIMPAPHETILARGIVPKNVSSMRKLYPDLMSRHSAEYGRLRSMLSRHRSEYKEWPVVEIEGGARAYVRPGKNVSRAAPNNDGASPTVDLAASCPANQLPA